MAADTKIVGKSPARKEGRDKVTGKAIYIDDMKFDGCLYAKTVRTTIPRGRLKGITFEPGVPWDEFTVVTAKDIPGKNIVPLLPGVADQPLLVEDEFRHIAEPVAIIAHSDKGLVEKALTLVKLDCEALPAVTTIDESSAEENPQHEPGNVLKSFKVEKGDVTTVWDEEGLIITEEVYETHAQEQLYIEPNGVAATYTPEEGITIWGSMQCPYYILKGLMPLFNLPEEKIRVVFAVTGGGFGGKEEYPTILAAHAALISMKAAGKPVKLIFDRTEDLWASTKRHPCRTRIRSAFTPEGKIKALDIDATMDGGAYVTLSPVVLSRGTLHSFGPYVCDHVLVNTRAMMTNSPSYGAYRGFGAPQTIFALEMHMDDVAVKLGIEPHTLREKNVLKKGDSMATGQVMQDDPDIAGVMNRAMKEADYIKKRKEYDEHNKNGSSIKKGIGLALFMHGAGFTGSGEVTLESVAAVELKRDGIVRILTANTEIGQGVFTTFSQIVSDAVGIPYENIEVATPDTAEVPNSGPTVASRTCMVVGNLVKRAADELREVLVKEAGLAESGYSPEDFAKAGNSYLDKNDELKVFKKYDPPPGIEWDDQTYQGSAYGAYAWACYIADVEIDTVTYQTTLNDFVAVQDVGTVIHEVIAKGQIEGGVAQAVGWALYEDYVVKDGAMVNTQMTNYIMPTTADVPPIRVYFYENPYPYGPYGAKGIGELPMDGPAPAVASAVGQAVGNKCLRKIPLIPEKIMEIMESA